MAVIAFPRTLHTLAGAAVLLFLLGACDNVAKVSGTDAGGQPKPDVDCTADPSSELCPPDELPGGGTSPSLISRQGQDFYLSGVNLAWLDFAADFGSGLHEDLLHQMLDDVQAAGGNSVRWWVHADGSRTPEWGLVDGQRLVTAPGGNMIEDLRRALDIASQYNIFIVPTLWSFDMLRNNEFRQPPTLDNYRLLVDEGVLQSYIDNALLPMVEALNDHPQLFAWDLFNEAEVMTESWFHEEEAVDETRIPSRADIVRTQAVLAAAIHRAAEQNGQQALVTTGSKSMAKYNSDVAGGSNWYRDDRMIAAAGGDRLAVLDFYKPHYYDNEGRGGDWSVFHHAATHWGVDKPTLIGKFYADQILDLLDDPVAGSQMCQRLADNGYAGAWPWQWRQGELRASALECVHNVMR